MEVLDLPQFITSNPTMNAISQNRIKCLLSRLSSQEFPQLLDTPNPCDSTFFCKIETYFKDVFLPTKKNTTMKRTFEETKDPLIEEPEKKRKKREKRIIKTEDLNIRQKSELLFVDSYFRTHCDSFLSLVLPILSNKEKTGMALRKIHAFLNSKNEFLDWGSVIRFVKTCGEDKIDPQLKTQFLLKSKCLKTKTVQGAYQSFIRDMSSEKVTVELFARGQRLEYTLCDQFSCPLHEPIKTTVSQLISFQWLLEHCILAYVHYHYVDIESSTSHTLHELQKIEKKGSRNRLNV